MKKPVVILSVENDLCAIRAEIEDAAPGVPFVHMTMKSWGKREKPLWDFIWSQFKLELRRMGYPAVCALIPEDDPKLHHFSVMSGMREYMRLNGNILMRTEV